METWICKKTVTSLSQISCKFAMEIVTLAYLQGICEGSIANPSVICELLDSLADLQGNLRGFPCKFLAIHMSVTLGFSLGF